MVANFGTGTFAGLKPRELVTIGNELYFQGGDVALGSGSELWKSDGTAAGTVQILDVWPGVNGSRPSGFVELNGLVYFTAYVGTNGRELFRTDGTAAGTVRLTDHVRPGDARSNPADLTPFAGKLFFTADSGAVSPGIGRELWTTDGTVAGTTLFKEINPARRVHSTNPTRITTFTQRSLLRSTESSISQLMMAPTALSSGKPMVPRMARKWSRISTRIPAWVQWRPGTSEES
jgi:ELWxxDGT repeat protein